MGHFRRPNQNVMPTNTQTNKPIGKFMNNVSFAQRTTTALDQFPNDQFPDVKFDKHDNHDSRDENVFAFVGARTLIKGSLGAPVVVQAYTVSKEHLNISGVGAGRWVGT